MTNRYHCDDKQRLVAFGDGEASEREHAEVEAHLAVCATCAEEADELRAVRVDLAAWNSRPTPISGFGSSARA